MSNVGRPRLTQSTSTFRDIHEDGGLKPAQKRRVELLEGRVEEIHSYMKVVDNQKAYISDLQKQVKSLHGTLADLRQQLSKATKDNHDLDSKSNAHQQVYEGVLRSVNELTATIEVLRLNQDHCVTSSQLGWELNEIRHDVDVLKGSQTDLKLSTSEEKNTVSWLSQRLDLAEQQGEKTSKRLKTYHESQESLESLMGEINPLGPSLAQLLDSQNSTVAAVQSQNVGMRTELNNFNNHIHRFHQKFSAVNGSNRALWNRFRPTESLAKLIPDLESRVVSLEDADDVRRLQTSLHHLIESNNQKWDTWRPRIRALEANQQSSQLPNTFKAVEGNVKNLNTLYTQLGNRLQTLEHSRTQQDLRDARHAATEQRVDANNALLRREMTDLDHKRGEMVSRLTNPLKQDTLALAAEMRNAQSIIEQIQRDSAAANDQHLTLAGLVEEKFAKLEASDRAYHASNAERLANLETSIKQAVDGNSELMTYAKAPTTDQCTVYRNSYVHWLKSLDFRLPDGMKGFKDRLVRVDDHMLFTHGGLQYFLKRADRFSSEPKRAQRDQRGLLNDDAYESAEKHYFEYAYRLSGYEAVHKSGLCEDVRSRLPQYMVHLGEVYIHGHWQGFCRKQVTNTGFHLFMDITKPAKPLWIVFCREASNGIVETLGEQWKKFNSLLAEPFDIAMVAESVYDWNQQEAPDYDEPRLDVSKVQSCMEGSAKQSEAVFTYPNLKALFQTLGDGWCEGSDVLPCSTL
ncbi:hypothetical protein LQW54_006301 [Pestalotiopsis sp. IQ-011]